jgi:hypothetical protein
MVKDKVKNLQRLCYRIFAQATHIKKILSMAFHNTLFPQTLSLIPAGGGGVFVWMGAIEKATRCRFAGVKKN